MASKKAAPLPLHKTKKLLASLVLLLVHYLAEYQGSFTNWWWQSFAEWCKWRNVPPFLKGVTFCPFQDRSAAEKIFILVLVLPCARLTLPSWHPVPGFSLDWNTDVQVCKALPDFGEIAPSWGFRCFWRPPQYATHDGLCSWDNKALHVWVSLENTK